jgi:hypothetical protein
VIFCGFLVFVLFCLLQLAAGEKLQQQLQQQLLPSAVCLGCFLGMGLSLGKTIFSLFVNN